MKCNFNGYILEESTRSLLRDIEYVAIEEEDTKDATIERERLYDLFGTEEEALSSTTSLVIFKKNVSKLACMRTLSSPPTCFLRQLTYTQCLMLPVLDMKDLHVMEFFAKYFEESKQSHAIKFFGILL